MKICSITTIPNSMWNFMVPEAIALSKDGWDSVVITSFSENDLQKIPDEIRAYSVPMERTYNLKTAVKCIFLLYRIFKKEKFDVVQYGTTHACLFGSIAAFLARTPHRIFLQWGPTGYNDFTGLKRAFTKSIEILIGKLSTTIRTVSRKNLIESVKDGLYPQKKASVVGEGGTIGVNLEDYPIEKRDAYSNEIRNKYGLKDSDFVFGFTGRISKPKGVNELLEAFKSILERRSAKLMLIGADESVSDIPLLEWAKVCPDIILTGPIPHKDMAKYFAAIDLLVHPTYREGFGMVLQEAMAIGTPIITTDIPGPSEVIEEGISGMLVPVKNSEVLETTMLEALEKTEVFIKLGKNGRRRVEKHFERNHRLKLLVEDKRKLFKSR